MLEYFRLKMMCIIQEEIQFAKIIKLTPGSPYWTVLLQGRSPERKEIKSLGPQNDPKIFINRVGR